LGFYRRDLHIKVEWVTFATVIIMSWPYNYIANILIIVNSLAALTPKMDYDQKAKTLPVTAVIFMAKSFL
jgi:hypothetical protein